MLTRVTGVRLLLVRHAMPDVQPGVPAREWHLGDDGRVAARDLGRMLPARAHLVASDEPKAVETLAEASGRSDVVVDADFGEVRRPHEWSGDAYRRLARAFVGGAAHAGWEQQASVIRRFDAAVTRHVAIADGRALVIGTHGMAMTLWLASRMPLHPDPPSFWAALRFPDVISVDSVDSPDRGR